MRKILMLLATLMVIFSGLSYAGEETTQWKVVVYSAHHLRDADWGIFFANPDPYVIVAYQPDSKAKFQKIGQTKVCKQTENPVWNATFYVMVKADADKRDGTFRFTLMDDDLFEDDVSGVISVKAMPMAKPEERKFKKAPKASLKIQIIAPAKPEPVPPRREKGTWELKIVSGKYLCDKADETSKMTIVVGYASGKNFHYMGSTKPITKPQMTFHATMSVRGPEKGSFAFLLTEIEKPSQQEYEKAALLEADAGEYHVKLPGTKRGTIEVVMKFTPDK